MFNEDRLKSGELSLLAGYEATNHDILTPEQDAFNQWLAENNDEHNPDDARIDISAANAGFSEVLDTLRKERKNEDYDVLRTGSVLDDTTVHSTLHRKTAHDLMYLGSTEQAIKDKWALKKLRETDTEILSPNDAFEYAKERGVETLRVDKPIGKNELEYKINRELTRRELTQELAKYQDTRDYSALQKALLLGAYVSGSFTGYELLATAGLSFLEGAGLALLLEKAAHAVKTGNAVYKGVAAAQIVANAQKAARAQRNAVKVARQANAAVADVRKADFATKLVYDAYNLGKIGTAGPRASHATVTIPMLIDGAISETPAALIKHEMSKEMGGDPVTIKDTLVTIATGGITGGIMPHAGTLIKATATAPSKIFNAGAEIIAKKMNAEKAEAVMRHYEAVAPAIDEAKAKTSSYTQEILDTINKEYEVDSSYIDEVVQVVGANLTEEEMATKHAVISLALESGGDPTVVNKIPFKTEFYSKVLGMYDHIRTNTSESYQDFIAALQSRGLKIGATKKLARYNLVEGLDQNPILEDLRQMMRTSGWGIGYRIAGEKGAIGTKYASAMNHEDAQDMLHNIYKAWMLEGTPEGQEALAVATKYQDRLISLKNQLEEIANTYDVIQAENKAAKDLGNRVPYPYKNGGQDLYRLSSGKIGSLRDALADIATLMLPAKKQDEYTEALALLKKVRKETEMTGHPVDLTDARKAEIANAEKIVNDVQEWQREVVNFLAHESTSRSEGFKNLTFFNLTQNIKGSASDTAYIRKTISELEKLVDSNDALLNLRKAYDDEVGDPEELVKRLNDEELPVSVTNTQITSETLRDMVNSADDSASRLATTKADFTAWVSSEAGAKVMESIDAINKVARSQVNKMQRLSMGYFNILRQNIMGSDLILDMSKTDIVNRFVTAFSSREVIGKLLNQEVIRTKIKNLSSSAMTGIFKESIPEFSAAVKSTLEDILTEAHLPQNALGTHTNTLVERAVSRFTDAINNGEIKLKLGELVSKETADEAVAAVDGAAEALAKQVVEEPAVEGAIEATRLWEAILTPFMDELRKEVTDMQNTNLNALFNTAKIWEKCLATPGKMSEVILGSITTSYLPTKGASESIENIASVATDWILFSKNLDEADKAHKFGGLREWAEDPSNIQEISENVAVLRAKQLGLLNKTELDQMTTSSKGYQVAKALLDSEARITGLMYNVGSNKTNILSLCASNKLRQANTRWLPMNFLNSPLVTNITTVLQDTRSSLDSIRHELNRLLPADVSKKERGYANHVMYRLERLDLQKHFNKDGFIKLDLNTVRDAFLGEHKPGVGSPVDQLIREHGEEKVHKAIKAIVDGLIGSEDGEVAALIKKEPHAGTRISARHASFTPKYLDDIEEKFHYKNLDALRDDVKYFGYDDLRSWFDEGIGTGKKAYAILAKSSSEPVLFFDNIKEMARIYASAGLAKVAMGEEAAAAMTKNVGSATFARALDYAVENMCGSFAVPASTGVMIAQGIRRMLTSPLLVAAGLNSLSDYNYQFQSAVNMGFANVLDLKSRWRIASKLFKACKQGNTLRSLYLSTAMRANAMHEMMYNAPLGLNSISSAYTAGVTEVTPIEDIFDQLSKGFASTIVDKFAFVGGLTKFNRANAAMTMMEFIGDWSGKTWQDIKANDKVLATFERFGFTEYEWDNIFSKDAMSDLASYVNRYGTTEMPNLGDGKMFFPDLIEEISDADIAKHLKAQKRHVSDINIAKYRQELMDKASAIVNSSADEMTTMPTSRIQGAASFHTDPNSWFGFSLSTMTQFQSFPIGMAYYQIGRKLGTFMDRTDPMYSRILLNVKWNLSTAGSFMAYWAESAVITALLLELVDVAKGNVQSIKNEDGSINTEALVNKATRAMFAPAAIASIFLDASLTSLEKGRGQGGGLALPVAPAASAALKYTSRVVDAATRESVEGQRAQAIGAAVAQNTVDMLGVPNSLFLKPWTTMFVTDYLERLRLGSAWYDRQDSRIERGFQPSYAQMLRDHFER